MYICLFTYLFVFPFYFYIYIVLAAGIHNCILCLTQSVRNFLTYFILISVKIETIAGLLLSLIFVSLRLNSIHKKTVKPKKRHNAVMTIALQLF